MTYDNSQLRREVVCLIGGLMNEGDYLIVENTNGRVTCNEFKRFMIDQDNTYLVDTRNTDLFGYNVSWNPNAYVRNAR